MQMPIFDTVTQEYLQATQNWFGQVQSAGMHLMVILALIQFSLQISRGIISGESNALSMMILTLKQLVLIAFLYYLISNAGTFLPELFNSFTALGIAGSNITRLDPSSVVNEGLAIASAILQSFNAWGVLSNISASIFGGFCCIATVICYGLIAADLMITLIESYFLVAVSGLFIAFGSAAYTLPMARDYLGMTVSVGIKLMMLYVMIAIGASLGTDWIQIAQQASQNNDWESFLGLAVGAIIYFLIVRHVPARIASAASHAFAISHISTVQGAALGAVANAASVFSGGTGAINTGAKIAGNLAGKINPMRFADAMHKASSVAPGSSGLGSGMSSHFKASATAPFMRDVTGTGSASISSPPQGNSTFKPGGIGASKP